MELETSKNLHVEKTLSNIMELRSKAAEKLLENPDNSSTVKARLEKIISSGQ